MPIAERRTAAIPATMRVAAMDRVGGPEVLTLYTLPVPSLNPGEVLIALHIAGVGGWTRTTRVRRPMSSSEPTSGSCR